MIDDELTICWKYNRTKIYFFFSNSYFQEGGNEALAEILEMESKVSCWKVGLMFLTTAGMLVLTILKVNSPSLINKLIYNVMFIEVVY